MPGEPPDGLTVGAYRLERLLGAGGTASVYVAERTTDGLRVALKLLGDGREGELARHRFVHEARAAAAVRHDNLVAIVDVGEADGRCYIAAELIDGCTLEERLRAGGPLAVRDLLEVVDGVAAGLDALHAASLVHRDVKPSNIMVRRDGVALLTDFGLARGPAYTVLTRPGQVVGTLDYLAPELLRGERATVATDVYALGCTVYTCAAGVPPFAGRSFLEVGSAILGEEPPDPGAARTDWGAALSRVVVAALAKDQAQRPSSAGAFAAELRASASLP